jgi:hypothetical protein
MYFLAVRESCPQNTKQLKSMRIITLITLAIFSLASFGQDLNKKIKNVNTLKEAGEFMKDNPTVNADIVTFISNADSSEIAKKIFDAKPGSTLVVGDNTYKILEIKPSFLIRASYIFLDGTKLSVGQVDSLRKLIISKYNAGTSFSQLAKEYTMDGNPNCDLGWVAEGMLVEEFQNAVKEHNKGDIFTVDVVSKKWYHVALKTFGNREGKTYSVLKIGKGKKQARKAGDGC